MRVCMGGGARGRVQTRRTGCEDVAACGQLGVRCRGMYGIQATAASQVEVANKLGVLEKARCTNTPLTHRASTMPACGMASACVAGSTSPCLPTAARRPCAAPHCPDTHTYMYPICLAAGCARRRAAGPADSAGGGQGRGGRGRGGAVGGGAAGAAAGGRGGGAEGKHQRAGGVAR